MQKQIQFKVKGMQRDLSASAFNPEYAYENKNIRIMPTDESTLLSIVNEKGNKLANINGVGSSLKGVPIGQALINDELIIFTAGDNSLRVVGDITPTIDTVDDITSEEFTIDIDSNIEDRIYKLWFNGTALTGKRMFRGQLDFDYKHPIETISFYENQEIKKIYWTDGLNQPRVINVAAASDVISKWNDDSFNFTRKLKLQETITIDRNIVANGTFSPGVIQYAFTYFNKYGQESNIFYTSPLYYVSYDNRGASPEDKVGNSFNIVIDNIDKSFDYVRIYSIHRTSIDAIPTVKRVVDLSIPSTRYITYTDNGNSGDTVDPTELLYVGGEDVIFGTLSQKDNTLFLGDITLNRHLLSDEIISYFKEGEITFSNTKKLIQSSDASGYYSYANQLKYPSSRIRTFKYLETYRFGIQFQHSTGKWSEPVWINDARNDKHITGQYIKAGNINLVTASYILNNEDIIRKLIKLGYVKARPLVVYPTLSDRECICQGILCPTVFNVGDRYNNAPFAQASWFVRPNSPYDIYRALHYKKDSQGNWVGEWYDRDSIEGPLSAPSENSRAGVVTNERTLVTYENDGKVYPMELPNKGAWAEFRHLYPIPSNDKRNAEIQCIWNPPEDLVLSNTEDVDKWVSQNSENFYIDQSIITMHSPDIEFDDNLKNLDTSGLQLRLIGIVPFTSFIGDIDIQTSTPPNNYHNSEEIAPGFYKEGVGAENISRFGWRGLLSGGFWLDEITGYKEGKGNSNNLATGFVVYPFHRNGSLNNTKYQKDGYRSAMLDKKKISNLRYSFNTCFLDEQTTRNFCNGDKEQFPGISGVTIFDSNEVSVARIPAPANSGLSDINYYGNVDKIISISRVGDKKNGYPIMTTGCQNPNDNAHSLFSGNYIQVDSEFTEQITGIDPVRMKYKSTPHAVMALNCDKSKFQWILPTLLDSDLDPELTTWKVNSIAKQWSTNDYHIFWDNKKTTVGVYQPSIGLNFHDLNGANNALSIEYGWLWLGELYNPNVVNRFGGKTQEAFENNQWLPCGEAVPLIDDKGVKSKVTIEWTDGDTYYQRYDNLKTYPFSLEDQNAITDIASFMCETRVNIDGRYDRNRGQLSNFAITPTNFNLLNDAYSQQNNFFNYRAINHNKLNLDNFHNSITWTKTKVAGELVDTWTNITLASTLDLDGDKGKVRALRRLNNQLVAFQDRGISQILYNENMQITSTEGVPIEIANSGKVNGKRYLSDKIGCANKWSICETSNGIYFIDDTTKGIFLFNGKLDNLSDRLGFHSWINAKSTGINIWNPVDFNGFVTYYDKVNGDVFFISKDECLAFSEPIGQFTSFYSYEGMPYFINLEDRGIALNTAKGDSIYKVWLHNEGEYNMYFNKYQPFYTTVIANPDMAVDKIFNNLEFRADSWEGTTLLNTTFDTLTTWNEYQSGTSTLNNILGRPSELKKKFRVWRANIPRAKSNGRDRMRNPWLYVKLSMEGENTNKTILHDMIVHYFE